MSDKENKIGIEESKDVIEFCEALVDQLHDKKADDGKIDGAEIGAALAATASSAIRALWGAGEISAEMKDLTDAERTELVDMAMPVLLRIVQLFAPEK